MGFLFHVRKRSSRFVEILLRNGMGLKFHELKQQWGSGLIQDQVIRSYSCRHCIVHFGVGKESIHLRVQRTMMQRLDKTRSTARETI